MRIVTDNPQNNMEHVMNLAFEKNGEVWIRGGYSGKDCTLSEFMRQICWCGCSPHTTDPEETAEKFMECSMDGCALGTVYWICVQATELRECLKKIEEDTERLRHEEADERKAGSV